MSIRQRTPHLIGRSVPLRALFDALEGLDGGAGELVLVGGEAGIGKTRLLDEFAGAATDVVVARGGCIEDVAYAPWTDVLWWLLTSDDALLDALPAGVRAQLGRLVPQLGASGHEAEAGGQHLLFEAVVALLAHVAAHTKLVVVVDDVHWIDPASRELLRHVAGNLRRLPILLVAAYRPEDAGDERQLISQLGRLAHHRIALEGLPYEATAEMAAFLLGDDTLSSSTTERIARDAEGNPLFVEELVAARVDDRMPETLRDLMLVRFDTLDDDARQLVRTAAVIGPRVPRAWLAGAAGLDGAHTRDAARAAVDAGVLVADSDGRGYAFRHALLRQAVLDEIVPDDSVLLHRAIAVALSEHPEWGAGLDRSAELARHWDAAEDAGAALRWLVVAARDAEATYAFDAAAQAYERALFWWDAVIDAEAVAGRDRVDLVLAAADALGLAGHIDRAADRAREGLEGATALDPTRGVEAAGRMYPLLWTADRASELFELTSETLLPVLDRVEPRARARFLVSTVHDMVGAVPLEEIRGPAARMTEAVGEVVDPDLEARSHAVMASLYEAYGESDQIDEEYDRAVAIAREAGLHSVHALALYNRAGFYSSVPRHDACIEVLDEVDELVERFGIRRFFMPARCLRALVACLSGDLDASRSILASIESLPAEGYDAWFRTTVRAMTELFAGNYTGAVAALDPDVVGVPAPKDADYAIRIAMLRADALGWLGDDEGAQRAVDGAESAASTIFDPYWQGMLAMVAMRFEADAAVTATTNHRLDLIERAQERATAICARWSKVVGQSDSRRPLVGAYTQAIEAEHARLLGDDVAARQRGAAEAFDAIAVPYYATYFRWRQAHAMLDGVQRPAGTEILRSARGAARTHGFEGLDAAITEDARTYQLRLGPGRTTVDGDEPLSAREVEVLRLMADGLSNPEIAEALFISRRTAAQHVSNILHKLGVASRSQAVLDASRRGLV